MGVELILEAKIGGRGFIAPIESNFNYEPILAKLEEERVRFQEDYC
jgi:hypothetical protein